MEKNWVINTDYTASLLEKLKPKNRINACIQIRTTSRKSPFAELDNFIIVQSNPDDKQFQFTYFGQIISFEEPKIDTLSKTEVRKNRQRETSGQTTLQYYLHTVNLEITDTLKNKNELLYYTYSLLCIYQYAFPERHFQQAFRQISLDDFETLTAQKIYIARTAFGNLINALPIKSKYDFTMYAIDEYGTMEFKGLDFIRAYNFLWQYITNNILSQGKLLVSTYELMQRHLRQTGMPIESVGFVDWGNTDEQKTGYTDNLFEMVQLEISDWDEDKVPSDSIANQAWHFQQLFLYMEHGLKQAHLEELTRNDVDEKRFVKLFEGVDWPVDYSV